MYLLLLCSCFCKSLITLECFFFIALIDSLSSSRAMDNCSTAKHTTRQLATVRNGRSSENALPCSTAKTYNQAASYSQEWAELRECSTLLHCKNIQPGS